MNVERSNIRLLFTERRFNFFPSQSLDSITYGQKDRNGNRGGGAHTTNVFSFFPRHATQTRRLLQRERQLCTEIFSVRSLRRQVFAARCVSCCTFILRFRMSERQMDAALRGLCSRPPLRKIEVASIKRGRVHLTHSKLDCSLALGSHSFGGSGA